MSGMTGPEHSPEQMDSNSRALKLQTDTPHLVNIGGDRLSTSVTLHPIPQGRVTLGCGPGVDIHVHGTGVLPQHCHIENSEGVVTIYPLSENVSIDGTKIYRPTRLSQGVMLTIGRSNYMRFNHPAEAKIIKSVLPNPRISMAPINFEPENMFQPKFNKKPPAVPKRNGKDLIESGVEEPVPSSIMTKVSKFEFLAQQNFRKSISPKVFSANLVTVNTPAKDVLGKSPPDLQSFSKNLPQNALNYSELNYIEKDQVKTPDRVIFGKKSPQYVNVGLSEQNVNNRVVIYENGCIPKSQNVNLDHNELNNKTSSCTKNINLHQVAGTPAPSYRNPSPHYRSVTPSPVSNTPKIDHRRSGSMGELNDCLETLESLAMRNNAAEVRRTQAQQERIQEQENEKAEQQRLEEILNMCVEYEKQEQNEKNKVTPNRIKTNGSLPRDKRQYGPLSPVYTTPPPSPGDVEMFHNEGKQSNHHSYENVSIGCYNSREILNANNYENVEIRSYEDDCRLPKCGSPYENVHLQQNSSVYIPTNSPRTRIKTIVSFNRENSQKEAADIIENKFAILKTEQYLLQKSVKKHDCVLDNNKISPDTNKVTPTKFIFPLAEPIMQHPNNIQDNKSKPKSPQDQEQEKHTIERISKQKKALLGSVSSIKRQLAELDIQKDELYRDLELEYALISGENKSKQLDFDKIKTEKEKLVRYAQSIEEKMQHGHAKKEEDQKECKMKLEIAQDNVVQVEHRLSETRKSDPNYEDIFEQYLQAQDVLDNERKTFEDLEFHHLEKEADWLASREEIQREIVELSKRLDDLSEQIEELDTQKSNISKNDNPEVKVIKKRSQELLVHLHKITTSLNLVDEQLSLFSNQESEQEDSTDSDSDKSKDLDNQLSNLSLNVIHDMSCSVIVSNTQTRIDQVYDMSQSFSEKLFQDKDVLETGIVMRCPSQDDIDRISKVTSDAPINMDKNQGSLGRKTIESLKDIERQRHIHLCQKGYQVIENERQRVFALQQRAQQEVRNEWEQRRIDSMASSDSDESRLSREIIERKSEIPPANSPNDPVRSESDGADSPRPMSEISEMSVEIGGTVGRKRVKSQSDKQRPLTRYLPIRGSDLDLLKHIESAGHQVVLCPHVIINSTTCRGFLHKKGSKLNGWSKRWFVFDRNKHTFTYYNDKSEKKTRGGAYFQAIEEVYLDHLNSVKSPNPQLTFIVKTHERFYYLLAPSPEAMRIWVDVVFTGAEGYREFEHGT